MIALFFQNSPRFVLPFLLLVAACSAPLVLDSKSAATPRGVDLSGMWLLRDQSDKRRPTNKSGLQDGIIPAGNKERSRRTRSSGGATVPVFLEYGTSLKITQTQYGIFISYDRSVVEEFTFGENRTVEIGPIEALRVSGWEGSSFVIETLDDSGTTLFESWQVDGSVLTRKIRIAKGDKNSFVQTQVFDRQ
jgi:hypothetical protein